MGSSSEAPRTYQVGPVRAADDGSPALDAGTAGCGNSERRVGCLVGVALPRVHLDRAAVIGGWIQRNDPASQHP